MTYKKVKVRVVMKKATEDEKEVVETRDYIQKRTKKAIYQAPDTPAGEASLDKRK